MVVAPWSYPDERYYDGWSGERRPTQPTDGEIKSSNQLVPQRAA